MALIKALHTILLSQLANLTILSLTSLKLIKVIKLMGQFLPRITLSFEIRASHLTKLTQQLPHKIKQLNRIVLFHLKKIPLQIKLHYLIQLKLT